MHARCVVLSAVGLALAVPSFAGTNIWTKTTSGNWEEPFWSLGQPPSESQEVIVFNNPGFKALTVGPSTVANHPDSLRINTLYVDARSNSHNLMLLNYAGVNVPLATTSTYIGRGASLLSYSSAFHADQFAVNGKATFAEFAETQLGQAWVGTYRFGPTDSRTNTAQLTLSNGLFSAASIRIADGNSVPGSIKRVPGIFNQYGGTNRGGSVWIGNDGRYSLHRGALDLTNGISLYTSYSLGGQPAQFLLSGGTLRAPGLSGYTSRFTQSGGRAEVARISFYLGPLHSANGELSGGVLVSSNFTATAEDRGSFTFAQSGGVHTNSGKIVIRGPPGRRGGGAYVLGNGLLFTPELELLETFFSHEAGTSRVQRLSLSGSKSSYVQSPSATTYAQELSLTQGSSFGVGGQLWTSNTTVQGFLNGPSWMSCRGQHQVQRRLLVDWSGIYRLSGGTLSARFITLSRSGTLRLEGSGNIATNELLIMRGGILLSVGGNYRFGGLRVPAGGTIDFAYTNSSTLRFTDAGDPDPALNTELQIRNWTRGAHHLFVGNNAQAIKPRQLSVIHFVNPGGYPPGTYRAGVTAGGEIVPAEFRTLSDSGRQNRMVLTWPEGYQLYSSTNVIGPYEPVAGVSSPYTVSFTDAQRFFIFRPVP